jgi:hypothetical protein
VWYVLFMNPGTNTVEKAFLTPLGNQDMAVETAQQFNAGSHEGRRYFPVYEDELGKYGLTAGDIVDLHAVIHEQVTGDPPTIRLRNSWGNPDAAQR